MPYAYRYNPILQDGGYMLVSKTVWDEDGNIVVRNTRVEVFHGEPHLYSIAPSLGNILGDPVSSTLRRFHLV